MKSGAIRGEHEEEADELLAELGEDRLGLIRPPASGSGRTAPRSRSASGRASTGPGRSSTTAVARIFGMKRERLLLDLRDGLEDRHDQAQRRGRRAAAGGAIFIASSIADDADADDCVLAHTGKRLDEGLGDQVPAVDEDEQEDLERQRDEDGRQHHHAHRHQRRRDDEVDDQERQEDQEPDLERRLELGDDERRDQDVGRDVGARLGRARACRASRTARGPCRASGRT